MMLSVITGDTSKLLVRCVQGHVLTICNACTWMSAGEVPHPPTRQKRPGFRVGYARAAEERPPPPPQLPAAQPAWAPTPLQHLGQQSQPDQPAVVSRASSTTASEHAGSVAVPSAVPPSPASPVAPVSAMGAPPPRLRQSSSELDSSPSTQPVAQPDLPQPAGPPADVPLADPLLDWAEPDSAAEPDHAMPPLAGSGPSADRSLTAAPAFNLMDEPSLQVSGTARASTDSDSKTCDYVHNLNPGDFASSYMQERLLSAEAAVQWRRLRRSHSSRRAWTGAASRSRSR